MIAVTCRGCHHQFEVPDIRAGVEVLCPPCGARVRVPRDGEEEQAAELVGAHARGGAHSVGGDARGATARTPTTAGRWHPASNVAVEWDEPDFDEMDDGTRNFEPHIEDDLRRKHLFRIGLALTIAFLVPIAGAPGSAFPQFSAFPGMNLAGLLMLLPLFAGLTLMALSKQTDPPLRGIVILAAGAAMFGLMLVDREVRTAIGESLSALPTSFSLSGALAILGMFGLLISTRVRWYRPISHHAYVIGAVAAGCYVFHLFIPANSRMPIGEPLQMFRMHKLMGIGMFAHIGLMAAAAVLCVINFPATLASNASTKAGRAFLCLVGAIVIPAVLITFAVISMFSAMSMPGANVGSPAMMIFSSVVKFGVMYGGLALLVPIGIADLLIGRP